MLRKGKGWALFLIIFLLALPIVAAWLANKHGQVDISGLLTSAQLIIRVPGNKTQTPFEVGPPEASDGLRLIGMDIRVQGLEGFIQTQRGQVRITPADRFILHSTSMASYIQADTIWPLTVSIGSGKAIELKIEPKTMFGPEVGRKDRTITAVEIVPEAETVMRGEFHARSVKIERLLGIILRGVGVHGPPSDGTIQQMRLTLPEGQERSGPIEFSSNAQGGAIRIFFVHNNVASTQLGIHTNIDRLQSTDTGGRFVVGARSISLSGGEAVQLGGAFAIRAVGIEKDRVAYRVNGTASYATLGGESIIPSALERLASQPLWAVIYGSSILAWGALVQTFMKFLFTGKWNGG